MSKLIFHPIYPTRLHAQAVECILSFFATMPEVDTVILTGSTAWGKATRDSSLDILALVPPDILATQEDHLYHCWGEFCETEPVFERLAEVGRYAQPSVTYINGMFRPASNDGAGSPDSFELDVGSALAYGAPLWERGIRYQRLREAWLPYYDEKLRHARLAAVRRACRDNLDHIPLAVDRGMYFRAFDQLYAAFRCFLQALFIARRTYPVAYDRWLREQVEGMLELPELYEQLPGLLEIEQIESPAIAHRAERLRGLLETYTGA